MFFAQAYIDVSYQSEGGRSTRVASIGVRRYLSQSVCHSINELLRNKIVGKIDKIEETKNVLTPRFLFNNYFGWFADSEVVD